jgi:hypothetical protein
VLPWPASPTDAGYGTIHWVKPNPTGKGPKGFWIGKPFKSAVDAVGMVGWLLQRPATDVTDVYFCTSLQAETATHPKTGKVNARRDVKNTLCSKVLFLDIDVKPPPKGYATVVEALTAVEGFCRSIGIPKPTAVVSSGVGVHCYWIGTRALPTAEWLWYAERLKQAAADYGLLTDAMVTADIVRILRVPQTFNHKTNPPKPVVLLKLRDVDIDFDAVLKPAFANAVAVTARAVAAGTLQSQFAPLDPSVFPPRVTTPAWCANLESASDGLDGERPEFPPLDHAAIFTGCKFMGKALAEGGATYDQPQWMLSVLAATFMPEGRKIAHKISKGHAGYNAGDTDAMYDRKEKDKLERDLGFPRCATIEASGCKDCALCPHRALDKSPLNLGIRGKPPHTLPSSILNGTSSIRFRDCYQSGQPKPSLANAVIAIRALGIAVRCDLFHNRINVSYNGQCKTIREGSLTDDTVSATRSLINNTYEVDCGDGHTLAAIREIAFDHAYDPVKDLLADCQAKWDRVKRLDSWVVRYLGCGDTPLNGAIGRAVLIAAVRRAREPGCKFDNITVLEGVEGTNKSTAIRVLAGDENFSDQSIIGAKDKEVQEQLDGVWMHENADLAGMKRADVEHVKAFASRQVDRARPAYGRVREDRPRRSIEWGTTNDDKYLLSQTGNRRIWPLKTGRIDIEALKRDREQLLGEAAAYEAAGESITLEESLWADARDAQEQRRVIDPWEDTLANMPDHIVHTSGDGQQRVSSADVLTFALHIPPGQQTSAHAQRLAYAMALAGWTRNPTGRVSINGTPVRGYLRRRAVSLRASQQMPPFTPAPTQAAAPPLAPAQLLEAEQSENRASKAETAILEAIKVGRAADAAHETMSRNPYPNDD